MEKKQKEVKRTRYQKVSKSPTQDINDKEVIMNTRKRSPDKYQQPQQTHSNIRASNQVFTEKATKENKTSSKSINSISHPLQRNMKAKPAKEDSQSSSPIEDSDNDMAFDYRINIGEGIGDLLLTSLSSLEVASEMIYHHIQLPNEKGEEYLYAALMAICCAKLEMAKVLKVCDDDYKEEEKKLFEKKMKDEKEDNVQLHPNSNEEEETVEGIANSSLNHNQNQTIQENPSNSSFQVWNSNKDSSSSIQFAEEFRNVSSLFDKKRVKIIYIINIRLLN